MRRILCLHLPYLASDRVRRDNDTSAAETRPLVLAETVGAARVVAHACPRVRRRGVRPGVSVGQALALVPELVVQEHDPQRDRAVLERLAAWALRLSPVVEAVAPDVLLLDISGCQRLFGGEANIIQQALRGLRQQGFYARAAIADTVGAAWAVAVGSTQACTVVPPGQGSAYLAPLAPATLRIVPQVNQRLDALGVRTIGDLLMLPRSSLPARFGSELVLRLQQALGEVMEPVAAQRAAGVPYARRRFEDPLTDGATLQMIARELLGDVFKQVLKHERALRRLDCVCYFERAAPRVLTINLARASRTPQHVAPLLEQRLASVDLTPGLVAVMLVARQTSRYHGTQGDLFEPADPGDDEALGSLLDRLASRVGQAALVRPQPIDDFQPERAYRYQLVVDAGCAAEERQMPVALSACPRPVRLLPRPLLVRAIALMPESPPTWFAYGGAEYLVADAIGPERIETAWWRGPDVRRDYFRVMSESGAWFWLFRTRGTGAWYLHGFFV